MSVTTTPLGGPCYRCGVWVSPIVGTSAPLHVCVERFTVAYRWYPPVTREAALFRCDECGKHAADGAVQLGEMHHGCEKAGAFVLIGTITLPANDRT